MSHETPEDKLLSELFLQRSCLAALGFYVQLLPTKAALQANSLRA